MFDKNLKHDIMYIGLKEILSFSKQGEKLKVLELFCGTKSFASVAQEMGMETITSDYDPTFEPDICADITKLTELPKADIIWASPPCEHFSVASIGKYWNVDHTPKNDKARDSLVMLEHTIKLILNSGCKYYFIENPRGKMRKMKCMEQLPIRHTVTYCQYGDTRMKPTDIWTNCEIWKPKPICKNGDPCHVSAPRGSRTGTQGIKLYKDRSRVPSALGKEILEAIVKGEE